MGFLYKNNDTDIYVSGLQRSRDQSPIVDAILMGSICLAIPNTITNATNANPVVITSVGHGLTTGQQIFIDGVEGNLAANGAHTVTVVDANTFSIDAIGSGAYTQFGNWYLGVPSAVGVSLPFVSGSSGDYVGTIPGSAPFEIGTSYVRFVECSNYGFRAGPTPVTVTSRS